MTSTNANYYAVRAEVELQLGDQAVDSTVAAIHYELAFRYSLIAADDRVGTTVLRLVSSNDDPNFRPGRSPAVQTAVR